MGDTDTEETEMVEHSRQALVGAIGGTYISLAIADIDELTLSNFALLNSASFKSPMEAIARYLKSVPRFPDKVGLAIAGHVEGERATMSHLPWSFSWNDIRAVTGGAQYVHFVNEFEALALAVPRMSAYDLLSIRNGKPAKYGTKLAISAGTGVGSAALIWSGNNWFATSGDSGRATFPATIGDEFDIRAALSSDGSLAAGDVLTGKGLVALYNALVRAASGGDPKPITPEEITKAGLSGENEIAHVALDLMTVWLGRFAGDVATHFGATGGVYLTGGMPSSILSALNSDRFLEGFERGGSERTRLDDVPVYVIKTGADAGMRGAAVALANSLPVRAPAYRRVSA
jgi:glucokinase